MATSLVEVESLLAIDVGSVNTRAFLFGVADGSYRFLAAGTTRTTNGGPYNDIAESVYLALERLQEITGRTFLGKDRYLIIPAQPDGSGVDAIVLTISSGPAIKSVVIGLLSDVSVESAQRLVAGTYAHADEVIGLNDRRHMDTQIDAIIRLQPDIVVVTGGTEGGASRSVTRMLEMLSLACRLIPVEKRPQVVYAGNSVLADKARKILDPLVTLRVTTNVRPDFDTENLNLANETLVDIVKQVRLRQMGNIRKLSPTLEEHFSLSASAFGRMVRFLSQTYEGGKGVLGIDLGASNTIIAAGFAGKLALSVCPNLGVGEGLAGVLPNLQINDLTNWLPVKISDDYVRSYLYNKPLYPAAIPATLAGPGASGSSHGSKTVCPTLPGDPVQPSGRINHSIRTDPGLRKHLEPFADPRAGDAAAIGCSPASWSDHIGVGFEQYHQFVGGCRIGLFVIAGAGA